MNWKTINHEHKSGLFGDLLSYGCLCRQFYYFIQTFSKYFFYRSKNISYYRKDRLKNSVFLSLSACTKRSARKLNQRCVQNDAKLRSGVRDLEPNKHQLLHRIQSIRTFTNLNFKFQLK